MQTKECSSYHLSNLSLLRPGTTMSIAMQNVTEFQKNEKTMTKHSKTFSFALEKYNITWTFYIILTIIVNIIK